MWATIFGWDVDWELQNAHRELFLLPSVDPLVLNAIM